MTGARPEHTDNHWMDEDGMDVLIRVINEFYVWSISSENPDSEAISLGINDISLITGGAFEYEGDWNTIRQHSFHRVGLSVDIDQRYPVDGIFVFLTQLQRDRLTEIMRNYGAEPFDEPTIHYGFNGEN